MSFYFDFFKQGNLIIKSFKNSEELLFSKKKNWPDVYDKVIHSFIHSLLFYS